MVACYQGDRGPPGLPAGIGDEWKERIVTLKVLHAISHFSRCILCKRPYFNHLDDERIFAEFFHKYFFFKSLVINLFLIW